VKLSGSFTLPLSPERTYELLRDPMVLARSMPGTEHLEAIGDNEYAMRMKMALASVCGLFDGKVRIADQNPPISFRLIVEGAGKIGFMKGDGCLTLGAPTSDGAAAPGPTGTTVAFDGDVQVGGTIANVGQRLIEMTAKMLIKRFFERISKEAAGEAGIVSGAPCAHSPADVS
jgi:carbon monoxide dehydrogenase subunit G